MLKGASDVWSQRYSAVLRVLSSCVLLCRLLFAPRPTLSCGVVVRPIVRLQEQQQHVESVTRFQREQMQEFEKARGTREPHCTASVLWLSAFVVSSVCSAACLRVRPRACACIRVNSGAQQARSGAGGREH